jgi:hypothetical protein
MGNFVNALRSVSGEPRTTGWRTSYVVLPCAEKPMGNFYVYLDPGPYRAAIARRSEFYSGH